MARSVTNEVLGAKLDATMQRLEKVENKVDNLPLIFDNKFVSHDVFTLKLKEYDILIAGINQRILELTNRKSLINWVTPTISAVLGSVLTYLIVAQLKP